MPRQPQPLGRGSSSGRRKFSFESKAKFDGHARLYEAGERGFERAKAELAALAGRLAHCRARRPARAAEIARRAVPAARSGNAKRLAPPLR